MISVNGKWGIKYQFRLKGINTLELFEIAMVTSSAGVFSYSYFHRNRILKMEITFNLVLLLFNDNNIMAFSSAKCTILYLGFRTVYNLFRNIERASKMLTVLLLLRIS